jgi:hypothetical protein
LSDLQTTNEDWLYPQMIQAIKKLAHSIILVFSPTTLSNLLNYSKVDKPQKTTDLSGVIPIAGLKEQSNVEIVVYCI